MNGAYALPLTCWFSPDQNNIELGVRKKNGEVQRRGRRGGGGGGGVTTSIWFPYIALLYLSLTTSNMIGQLLSPGRLVMTIAKFDEIRLGL